MRRTPRYAAMLKFPNMCSRLFTSCVAIGLAIFAPPIFAQETLDTQQTEKDRAALKKAQKKQQAADAIRPPNLVAAPIPIVQDYEPNPAIWRLADQDTTIYLFGTYHILPAKFRWRNEAFDTIVKEAEELVVETSDDDSKADLSEFMMKLVVEAMSDERVTISARLSEGNRAKWFKIADETDMPRGFFDRMPLILSLMGAGLSIGQEQGSLSEFGVETILEAEFKAAGKPIGSIENGNEVMQSLLSIDEDGLIKELDGDLTKWNGKSITAFFEGLDGTSDEADSDVAETTLPDPFASEHSWAQGILEDLSMEEMKDTEFGKQMYTVLLTDRNRAWAEWLENRLDTPGTILLAVGAGHFEGSDSVQNMLTKRGLYAERIH